MNLLKKCIYIIFLMIETTTLYMLNVLLSDLENILRMKYIECGRNKENKNLLMKHYLKI